MQETRRKREKKKKCLKNVCVCASESVLACSVLVQVCVCACVCACVCVIFVLSSNTSRSSLPARTFVHAFTFHSRFVLIQHTSAQQDGKVAQMFIGLLYW